MKISEEDFEKIFDDENAFDSKYFSEFKGDNALAGLKIIEKYLPLSGIEGAEHDIIYAAPFEELIEAGITKEDAIELRKLNWMIEDECMACFV